MGILYLVSTPIGNLEDITLRAIRVLGEAEIIACEDTRKTRFLLKKIKEVRPPRRSDLPLFLSYYEENEEKRIPQILKFLKEGRHVALVSNAGTPTVSDPGFKLVREAIKNKIKVVPVPGASAVLAGLITSGFPTDKFLFLGFLPKKQGKRNKILKSLVSGKEKFKPTVIIYESPFRLLKTLKAIQAIMGDIEVAVCRELTKLHEEIIYNKISFLTADLKKKRVKGEITLILKID